MRKTVEGTIEVEICSTHYKHTVSLGHLCIPKSKCLEIAKKLSDGVAIDRILDDVRDNVCVDEKRSHIITKRDILNIEGAFSLRSVERHSDDATTVAMLVEELKQSDTESPVLFYKQQGVVLPVYNYLNKNDFVMVLQTPYQAHIMKEFGNNIVCIDSTFKTTGYDFTLITVMVIDEFGEGYPTGWCLTTREDHHVMHLFFETLKQRVGAINTRWIMTDDADQFYNAWKSAFSDSSHKLLCTWHVDRAWRGAIASKIANAELRCQVYHSLHTIAQETDINAFNVMLLNFEQQLQEHPVYLQNTL